MHQLDFNKENLHDFILEQTIFFFISDSNKHHTSHPGKKKVAQCQQVLQSNR